MYDVIIIGSGPAGRVSNEDVRSHAAGSLEGAITSPSSRTKAAPPPVQSLSNKYGGDSSKGDSSTGALSGIHCGLFAARLPRT